MPAWWTQRTYGHGCFELSPTSRCFACTLRNLQPQQAASLLLKEVYGFTIDETAAAVDATFNQVKNWLQAGRQEMERQYQSTCALVNKKGVCYQCVELDDYFNAERRNPLDETPGDITARLQLLKHASTKLPGVWHQRVFRLMDDVFD